jgi:hypothetical protein
MRVILFVKVAGKTYMTNGEAEGSLGAAEHEILDLGICGRHEYGVEGCIAHDCSTMKTDAFIGEALHAIPIERDRLHEIIIARNEQIRCRDSAEAKIEELQSQIEKLQENIKSIQSEIETQKRFMNI